jgi:predicted dehydrogenase
LLTAKSVRQLGVGVIGTGMAGSIHARSARLAGARLIGVCASTPERSENAADLLGAERAFADPAALINAPDIEVVHICTPNDLHHALASETLAANKHVICEKPLAVELAQAEELARLAATRGLLAATPFIYRYYPMVRQATALVQERELGEIALLSGSYLQDWLMGRDSSNWRVDKHRGGPSRAFADIGSHWCDLVEYVSGQRIAALSAQTRTLLRERPAVAANTPSFATGHASSTETAAGPVETEDAAVVQFNTATGAAGMTLVSQVSAGHKNHLSFELTGANGTLRFDQQAPDTLLIGRENSVEILECDPARLHPSARRYATLPAGHPQGFHDCFDAFVRDAYESIAAGSPREGLPTFDDGVRAAALTSAVLRSSRACAAWVDVDPAAASRTNDRHTGLDLSATDVKR